MRGVKAALFVCALSILLPAPARAQTTLAGVVKDSSGGVLPGVTVEASSPVLIEKTRSGVTDSTGQPAQGGRKYLLMQLLAALLHHSALG